MNTLYLNLNDDEQNALGYLLFVSDCMIHDYQQLCDYLGFENLGILSAKGVENLGDINNSPILMDAYELGKSIV